MSHRILPPVKSAELLSLTGQRTSFWNVKLVPMIRMLLSNVEYGKLRIGWSPIRVGIPNIFYLQSTYSTNRAFQKYIKL